MSLVSPEFGSILVRLPSLLTAWLPAQRWFRSKSRALEGASIAAWAPLDAAGTCGLAVVEAAYADGAERYAVPLVLKDALEADALPESARLGAAETEKTETGETGTEKGPRVWCDASREPVFHQALYALARGAKRVELGDGVLSGSPAPAFAAHPQPHGLSAKLLSAEQSNTSFAYSSGHFAKLYRRLEAAVNPEPETLRFLREAGYPHVPAYAAGVEWRAEGREPVTVALLQDWVSSRGDAWAYALERLQEAATLGALPDGLRAWAATLGARVAELHNALASAGPGDAAFAPEPLRAEDLSRLRAGSVESLRAASAALEAALPRLGPGTAALAREILALRPRLEARLDIAARETPDALKIRTHGDLHLGQILVSADDPNRVWILDFEGEPGRPLAEARRKHSPVRDAAGMMRSFHYASHIALREPARRPLAEEFAAEMAHAFQAAYFSALEVPASRALLGAYMLEKAVYELHYELNNRPDWSEIPLLGLKQLVTEY